MGDHLTTPMPCEVARGADLLVIERWAEQQRAELRRLLDELGRLLEHVESLEPLDAASEAPTSMLVVIDGMLEAAIERLDVEHAAVHSEADRTIELAIRDAAALLRQHRADEGVIERITDPAPRVIADLRRPRRAIELWRELVSDSPTTAAPSVAVPAPPGPPGVMSPLPLQSITARPEAPPVSVTVPPALVPPALTPRPPVATAPFSAPAVDAASDEGSTLEPDPFVNGRSREPSHLHVHDQFWAALPPDRPVRERIRRFAQRSAQ